MKSAPIPADEVARMADLVALQILDTPREPRFDAIAELAADVFDVPRVFVTFIDRDRMWWKSIAGFEGVEAPRELGFCSHAIVEPDVMVVPDASQDVRFADNPFVTGDFQLRFYAGVSLHGPTGQPVGALGLVDTAPRQFTDRDAARLRKFGDLLDAELARA
jgi:GAF domain-containing protein